MLIDFAQAGECGCTGSIGMLQHCWDIAISGQKVSAAVWVQSVCMHVHGTHAPHSAVIVVKLVLVILVRVQCW